MTFDEIISDALAAGELRDKPFSFFADRKARIAAALPKEVPYFAAGENLIKFLINKMIV